jgi:hypothetical protein
MYSIEWYVDPTLHTSIGDGRKRSFLNWSYFAASSNKAIIAK